MDKSKTQYKIPELNLFEKIDFFAALQSYLGSSIPLTTTLTNIYEHSNSSKLKRIAKCLLYELDHGIDFSKAILKFKKTIGNIYCNLISVGAESGTLPQISKNVYLALKKQRSTLLTLLTHLTYPAILIVGVIASGLIYLFFISPKLAKQYELITGDTQTTYMLQMSHLAAMVGHYFIPAIIVCAFAIWGIIREVKHLLTSKAGVKMPVIGAIIKYYNLSLFTRLLAISYAAGMPISSGILLACEAIQNKYIKEKLIKCASYITRHSVSESFTGTGLFSAEMITKVQIGEESGKLDERLFEISEDIDEVLTAVTVSALKLIEPLLLVLIGACIAVIGSSILKSMFYV